MANCIKCKAELPEGALYCHLCGKKQASTERKRRKRANGSGTIYKMQGNRTQPWAAMRNNMFLGSSKTYAGAQKLLERTTDADITDRYNLTFSQIYDRWRPVHAREVTASQMECYLAAYKHCKDLYDRKFRHLRKSDFQAVIIRMEEAGKSKSSCEKVKQLFGQLSKWAMDECIINQNHSRNVTITASQKGLQKPFTEAQIQAMQVSGHRAAAIALILIATGARPNELFKVPLDQCYDDYFIGGSKTDAGTNRVIAVSPVGLAAYRALLSAARSKVCSRLIDGYEGNKDTTNFRKRDFHDLMEQLGCPEMTPYACRHTFTTLAVKSGVKPELLRRMVGHSDIKVTDKYYTHLDKDDILAEISKIQPPPAVTGKLQAGQPPS